MPSKCNKHRNPNLTLDEFRHEAIQRNWDVIQSPNPDNQKHTVAIRDGVTIQHWAGTGTIATTLTHPKWNKETHWNKDLYRYNLSKQQVLAVLDNPRVHTHGGNLVPRRIRPWDSNPRSISNNLTNGVTMNTNSIKSSEITMKDNSDSDSEESDAGNKSTKEYSILADKLEAVNYDEGLEFISCNDVFGIGDNIRKTQIDFAQTSNERVLFLFNTKATRADEFSELLQNAIESGHIIDLNTVEILRIHIIRGKQTCFDSGFGEEVSSFLPNLWKISIDHSAEETENFMLKNLFTVQELSISNINIDDEELMNINLPDLRKLQLQHCSWPEKCFLNLLKNSPDIEEFYSHKLNQGERNLGGPLYLPNCREFCLRRCDCLSRLDLYLPRVEKLTLSANYDLSSVQILDKWPKNSKTLNDKFIDRYDLEDNLEEASKFKLQCDLNGSRLFATLKAHPRCIGTIKTGNESDSDDIEVDDGEIPTLEELFHKRIPAY